MQHSYEFRNAPRTCFLTVISLAAVGLVTPGPVVAQTVVPLAPFTSVTLHDGGEVILRHGSAQRVTLLKGSASCARATVADGGRLVIDRRQGDCPRGSHPIVEVLTPEITDIMVMNGGTIRSDGSFPQQAEIEVAVGQGGTIDLRSMTVGVVTAGVNSGGRILTKPQRALVANIAHGGAITYWGNPNVKSRVDDGGVVGRGSATDADKPLPECGSSVPAVPALPSVPPTRVRRATI